jgi:predicted nucleic acid-binding protein
MHLALTDLFRAKWSQTIHEEWIRNVLAQRPDLKRSQLERTKKLMDMHVRDCVVEQFEDRIDKLYLPDPNDRHVLAAAIHANADFIVTFNGRDFPQSEISKYGIQAIHPDAFIMQLFQLAPAKVI